MKLERSLSRAERGISGGAARVRLRASSMARYQLRLRRSLAFARDKLSRIELPPVDVRIPRVPRHDAGHPLAQLGRDDFRDDERLLPPQLVRVAELEAEHAEDVTGDVP